MVVKLAFSANHPFHTAKTFKMGLAKIGDIPKIGLCDTTQQLDFSLVIGPHFHNGDFGVVLNGKQGQWNPNVIVEVAFGGNSSVFFGEHGIDKLLGSGLPITAR